MANFELSQIDRISELSLKLYSLLVVTYGESGAAMRRLNHEIQDSYLWTCGDLAREIKELVAEIGIAPREVSNGALDVGLSVQRPQCGGAAA